MSSKSQSQSTNPAPLPVSRFRTMSSPPLRCALVTPGPSMTKQSHKDECDVNIIVARFLKTGVLPENGREPRYGDVSSMDFQEAMLIVADARSAFEALPALVRERFKNDPADMLRFCEDPANRAEAASLGLMSPPEPVPAPVPATGAVAAPQGASAPVPAPVPAPGA